MKTKIRKIILAFFVLGLAVVYSSSCKKTVEDLTSTCSTLTNLCGSKSVKYCVNLDGSGYYEYNGIQYSFTLTTVSTAATNVVHAMGCK
jgi:hypothetical protein